MTQRRSHASWAGRGQAALDPQALEIEARGEIAMVDYAAALAEFIKFFGSESQEVDNWRDLLDRDPIFPMAQIAAQLDKSFYYENRGAEPGDNQGLNIESLEVLLNLSKRLSAHEDIKKRLGDILDEAVFLISEAQTTAANLLVSSENDPSSATAKRLTDQYISPTDRVLRSLRNEVSDILDNALETRRDVPPHIGLLLGFFSMREKTRSHVNQITDKHLDFFFQAVLGLQRREAEPDTTTLAVKLAPDAKPLELPSGAIFEAGQSEDGEPVHYVSHEDIHLDHAQVSQVHTLNYRRNTAGQVVDVRQASAQLPLSTPIYAFGTSHSGKPAPLGLVIVSNLLVLPAGRRSISAKLRLQGNTDALASRMHASPGPAVASLLGVGVHAMGEEGKIDLQDATLKLLTDETGDVSLHLNVTVPEDAPALVESSDPSNAARGGRIDITLASTLVGHGINLFEGTEIVAVDLSVRVVGLPVLNARTPDGDVVTTAPIAPFGAQPMPGARFSFFLPDVAIRAKKARIVLNWVGLPETPDGVREHYNGYGLDGDFTAATDVRSRSGWTKGLEEHSLFPVPSVPPKDSSGFELPVTDAPAGVQFALRFTSPSIGFGHRYYQNKQAEAAIKKAGQGGAQRAVSGVTESAKKALKLKVDPPVEEWAPPLTPMIDGLTLDYHAETRLSHGTPPEEGILVALRPFGYLSARETSQLSLASVVGRSDTPLHGVLLLGLVATEPGQKVTLFFDVTDDARRVHHAGDKHESSRLEWRYRSTSGWRVLPSEVLLYDETRGLESAGRVALRLPLDTALDPSDLPGEGMWLAVVAREAKTVETVGKLRDLAAQAVQVKRVNPAPWTNALPGSVKRLIDKTTASVVTSVSQNVAGTGGREAETIPAFRARVSERLRHKSRILQPRDAEEIALDMFDDLGDAKMDRVSPGELVLTVVGRRSADTPMPRVSPARLREIALHLRERLPQGSTLSVRNVRFEPVRMRCWMRYSTEATPTDLNRLTTDLNTWIAPWMSDVTAPCPIGTGRLNPAILEAFLEGLKSVDYVTGLTLTRLSTTGGVEETTGRQDVTFAREYNDLEQAAPVEDRDRQRPLRQRSLLPGTPFSVLVPADEHLAHSLGARFEIGHMRIGTSFFTGREGADPQDDMHVCASTVGIGSLRIGKDFIPKDTTRPDQETH